MRIHRYSLLRNHNFTRNACVHCICCPIYVFHVTRTHFGYLKTTTNRNKHIACVLPFDILYIIYYADEVGSEKVEMK